MSKRFFVLLCSVLLVVPLLFLGCGSGSDGSQGPQGPQGVQGPPGDNGAVGPPGPVTVTAESCMVCHTTGRIADMSDASTTGVHYNYKTALAGLTVTVDNIVYGTSPDNASMTRLTTSFLPAAGATLTLYDTAAGHANGIADNTANLTYLRFAYARLTAPISAKNTTQWVRYTSGDRNPAHLSGPDAGGHYTMWTDVKTADFDATKPTRLLLLVGAAKDAAGNDATEAREVIYNFVPNGSAPTLSRAVVNEAACNGCHSQNQAGMRTVGLGHGGRYELAACVVCHTDKKYSAAGTSGSDGVSQTGRVMQNLVHRIHNAMAPTSGIATDNWAEVTYPQPVTNCNATCHTGTADADNWKNFPTADACNTCHDTVNFTTGAGHAGGAQPDANCSVCHPAASHMDPNVGASITEAHDFSAASALHPNAANVPEFDVTLALSAPSGGGGTYYATGETPTVTVTLKKHSDGTAVPASLYTAAKHATGTTAGTSLSKAALYVYGPRAVPVPVLTKAARTLSATGVPTQAQSLFVTATDNQVTTSASGFSYKLDAIPAAAKGTYMVRFIAADYGYVADNNYKIDSTAFQTIQINTATADLKIDGVAGGITPSNCMSCHGTGFLGVHVPRLSVVFNTDECVSCHDRSGNHADPIANRVHAVHSASVLGDLSSIDWSEVMYPQNMGTTGKDRTMRCTTCHSSGSTLYRTNAIEQACYGCHADEPGAIAHFQQNGGQ